MSTRPQRCVLSGANRGLGLEFVGRWLSTGREVFALARNPENSPALLKLAAAHRDALHVARCEVSDEGSVQEAARAVSAVWDAVDVLLNNAGTSGTRCDMAGVDVEEMHRVFDVNALGALRVSRALMPALVRGQAPRLVNMSSLMGSIEDNGSGGSWSYRVSKTALNMITRNMAIELEPKGVIAVSLHPGWVRTDMGGAAAPLSIEEAVRDMARTIDRLVMDDTGGFFRFDGLPLPW